MASTVYETDNYIAIVIFFTDQDFTETMRKDVYLGS